MVTSAAEMKRNVILSIKLQTSFVARQKEDGRKYIA